MVCFDRPDLCVASKHCNLLLRYQDVAQIPTESTSTMKKPKWKSPAYSSLIGNVLPRFLSFTQNPFPETPNHPHQPFPSLRGTYNYLRDFAEPYIGQEIRLNTEVLLVEELPQKKGWKVRIRDWSMHKSNEVMPLEKEEIWDAVVVCTGYYDNPIWPDTEGLDIVRKKGLALHSKWWEGPDAYEAKVYDFLVLPIDCEAHVSCRECW